MVPPPLTLREIIDGCRGERTEGGGGGEAGDTVKTRFVRRSVA